MRNVGKVNPMFAIFLSLAIIQLFDERKGI